MRRSHVSSVELCSQTERWSWAKDTGLAARAKSGWAMEAATENGRGSSAETRANPTRAQTEKPLMLWVRPLREAGRGQHARGQRRQDKAGFEENESRRVRIVGPKTYRIPEEKKKERIKGEDAGHA